MAVKRGASAGESVGSVGTLNPGSPKGVFRNDMRRFATVHVLVQPQNPPTVKSRLTWDFRVRDAGFETRVGEEARAF